MKKNFVLLFALLCAIYAKAYNVGDSYNKNGIKGVMVRARTFGEHRLISNFSALIMSLDKLSKKGSSDKNVKNVNIE